ncbi:hypothetical protein DTO013E5_4731 [Penicillium roqueforti]|uniref:Rab-GTPase-TBC domain n=1 Tax=Penicillium roqueforti (strain FM164) TaxID=1365484 RepID=W6PRP9_PENRF|nr:hypothetical protein CBS147355_5820 [Penicillium roqueforti]CDM26545.1 Rab-GTPase-TBC domain [Penicillium roqueforti FM164]KAI2683593.1 hypothetical protein LCP963914a_5994 [Penicillium roqueforti]KAI2708418.1 hypothetical protein CBS147332_6479 [Penicillium roqueforti]KAI2738569.1 hypothetical protein DTO012A1_6721 [Penicillium roqueforti]
MEDTGKEPGHPSSEDTSASEEPSNNFELDTTAKQMARAEKAKAIRKACAARDVEALAVHATSEGGLLEDDLRQIAWPILLRCDDQIRQFDTAPSTELLRHADEEQVELDVNRSFVYYPKAPEEEMLKKKEQLSKLITQVLREYPMLCYFQGYHDIVQVLLLVLGEKQAVPAVAQISLFRIRDYMLPSLSPAVKHLHLIPAIIETTDPELRRHLDNIEPFFALAATLTLYAHDIQEYSNISRVFDFVLSREPVVAIYLFAAMILSRKKELLAIPVYEPEMLHFTLSKLPCPLDLDGHILHAARLFDDHPPESLPFGAWKHIPWCSVLKTSRDPHRKCTPEDAMYFFEKQSQQIRAEERRKRAMDFLWSHRRSVGSVLLAILVGTASFYIRKKGLDTSIWSYVGRIQRAIRNWV